MIFRQIFDPASFTYTYLIASRPEGKALIVDPVLDGVEDYIRLLHELDLKLVKAIDIFTNLPAVQKVSRSASGSKPLI